MTEQYVANNTYEATVGLQLMSGKKIVEMVQLMSREKFVKEDSVPLKFGGDYFELKLIRRDKKYFKGNS